MRVTAPGKLILVGEYAVMTGAPAVVAAVDRRVEVVLEDPDGMAPPNTIRIRTDLPGEDAVRLDIDEVCAPDTHPRGVCFVRALAAAVLGPEREAQVLRTIGTIEVRSGALRDGPGGAKLGLGSSAAVAAALTTALEAWSADGAEPPRPRDVVLQARAAHRAAVGGSGSGVDVAASVLGGVHAFRALGEGLDVRPVALPPGVHVQVVWTGEPADTASFLAGVDALAEAHPGAHASAMATLAEAAGRALDACAAGGAADFLAAVQAYADGLRLLGERAGLPIVSDAHQRVIETAAAFGAVAKPSGAGGGDIAVVFAPEGAALADLEARLARDGFPPVRTSITPTGATVENQTRLTS